MNIKNFIVFLVLICASCSPGTHGSIKSYHFNNSKRNINDGIKKIFREHPEYVVPTEYKVYTLHYGMESRNDTADKWINKANADSVSFDFYVPKENVIIWATFVGLENSWLDTTCDLYIAGFVVPGEKWKFQKNSSEREQIRITSIFERSILNKLQ